MEEKGVPRGKRSDSKGGNLTLRVSFERQHKACVQSTYQEPRTL